MTTVDIEMMMDVADNNMPQLMAFCGVVCLHKCQIVICLWYVRQPTNCPQALLFDGLSTCV